MRGRLAYRIVMIGICTGVAAGPLLSTAQQAPKRPNMRSIQQRMAAQQRWWLDESKAADIGLGDEQIERLEEMADRGREQILPARQRYFQSYRALVETLAGNAADNELIAGMRTEVVEAWSEMTSVGVDQLIEMRKILTADQWAKLPEVAPRALRLGNVTLRGSGDLSSKESTDED